MIGKVFGILVTISFAVAIVQGNMSELSFAVTSSASEAIKLVITMAGSMCLWSGVASVLDECGFTEKLRDVISPVLGIIYPDAYRKDSGIKECASNISANFLGLGNAALPLGINTMKKFNENKTENISVASDDQVMFAVLATTPFQLLPVTLAAMREAAGSASPYEILLPVWICEIATTVFAVVICKLLSRVFT